jgi:hypothetical protein
VTKGAPRRALSFGDRARRAGRFARSGEQELASRASACATTRVGAVVAKASLRSKRAEDVLRRRSEFADAPIVSTAGFAQTKQRRRRGRVGRIFRRVRSRAGPPARFFSFVYSPLRNRRRLRRGAWRRRFDRSIRRERIRVRAFRDRAEKSGNPRQDWVLRGFLRFATVKMFGRPYA